MAEIGTDIGQAKSLLENNELVGIPTETVYGLAGNALEEEAILKIYHVKNRPKFDPLIAHIRDRDQLDQLVSEIPEKANALADAFWPGPLTLILNKKSKIPDLLTSGLPRIAVRVPNHSLTLNLLQSIDFPLAAPSANPFGYVSPVEAAHVNDQLGEHIDYILDGGRCDVGLESTIVGFEHDEVIVYRLGGKSLEELEDVVGPVKVQKNQSSNPIAPGMLKTHYAPGPKVLLGKIDEMLNQVDNKRIGIISFQKNYQDIGHKQFVLAPNGELDVAAKNIFHALRYMDDPSIELILAEEVPNEGLGMAINDRLQRAAADT